MDPKMTAKQIEYETRRAKQANMSLDEWLRKKSSSKTAALRAEALPKPKKPNLLGRLIERAHKPLKPKASNEQNKPKASHKQEKPKA